MMKMGKTGCTSDGSLDASKFNEPMPWIGLYIAAASAACAIGMAMDAFHGIRYRKFWFPSKFFFLNATTLTLLAVATKLSVDLNTSMPRPQDQLAKLSSTVLVCTVMANFMPSLGTTENNEMLANLVALGIFVVTVTVNICIELGTGVIYVFWREYAIILVVMIILLALKIASALTIPMTKIYFEIKSKKKLQLAMKECNDSSNRTSSQRISDKLKEDLTKYWMMAHTCNPQYVLARLTTCSASGAFCLVSAATLVVAAIRCFFLPWHFKFCQGDSDYKWSITPILVSQALAIGIGTVAPASRYFATINFRSPKEANKVCKNKFTMEKYWTALFIVLKETPLEWRFYTRFDRKLAHNIKDKTLNLCIYTQMGLVWLSKLVQLLSLMLIIRFLLGYQSLLKFIKWAKYNGRYREPGSESPPHPIQELSRFVMHLEGEEDVIDMMMQRNFDATGHWIRMGRKQQPQHVIRLLEKLSSSRVFEGVIQFDSDLVHSLDSEEPPNCWALPVVTLTSIAVALPNIEHDLKEQLRQGVHEALIYVRFIEDNLDSKNELINIRNAAAGQWTGVDIYCKWLDVDLCAFQDRRPKEIFEELAEKARHRFKVFRENDPLHCLRENASSWPIKVLAANSMYRICQTLLVSSTGREWESGKFVFDKLSAMIAEIIGACLTNLQFVISEQCHQSSIQEREDRTRHSILLLGETEKILEILEQQTFPSYKPEQSLHIDEWILLSKQRDLLKSSPSVTIETSTGSSNDLCLNID